MQYHVTLSIALYILFIRTIQIFNGQIYRTISKRQFFPSTCSTHSTYNAVACNEVQQAGAPSYEMPLATITLTCLCHKPHIMFCSVNAKVQSGLPQRPLCPLLPLSLSPMSQQLVPDRRPSPPPPSLSLSLSLSQCPLRPLIPLSPPVTEISSRPPPTSPPPPLPLSLSLLSLPSVNSLKPIKQSVSPSHSTLTRGQPVLALTRSRQMS